LAAKRCSILQASLMLFIRENPPPPCGGVGGEISNSKCQPIFWCEKLSFIFRFLAIAFGTLKVKKKRGCLFFSRLEISYSSLHRDAKGADEAPCLCRCKKNKVKILFEIQ